MKTLFPVLVLLLLFRNGLTADGTREILWFDQPASTSNESWNGSTKTASYINTGIPIGNGNFGGLITGGKNPEIIRLNEDSLWTGEDNPSGDYKTMGSYQALADLSIDLPGHDQATDYRRDLNLPQSLAHVTYNLNGISYQREIFCSHPAGVMVIHLTADKPGSYSGAVSLLDSHQAPSTVLQNLITSSGELPNHLHYETQVLAENEGGSLQMSGDKISFSNCDSLTFLVTAGTDYLMDFDKGFRGVLPHAKVSQHIQAASARSYEDLKAEHEKDYQSLFNRCSLDLGQSSTEQEALPTDKRRLAASKIYDPEMEELLFQYGRYLIISCSRPGTLPANLQGLWNDNNTPAWYSDYHTNINVQMNYWPVEVTNLAECHLPLLDLVRSQIPAWEKTTLTSKDLLSPSGQLSTRGWAVRTSHNIFGGMGWNWDKTANAWYCQHFWEHYAFGGDKTYLSQMAYPVMKEVCEYWEDHLKTLPDGRLVVPNGWSPEHGPTQDGVNYSQEIVWDLFNNYVQACGALNVDHDYQMKVADMRDKLAVPGVGSWGQLLEWMTELHDPKNKELDTPDDHHRHTSHLFGVFPGRQLSIAKTPELAAAALVSLKARGNHGEVKEWSFAWRTALYARLHDGADAQDQIMHFLGTTTANLFGYHGPMQIDGDFGITAGIAEMLVQSHEESIRLLPALPAEWVQGSVKGLRARGGFEISESWKEGTLEAVTIKSTLSSHCTVGYGSNQTTLSFSPGQSIDLDSNLKPKS